MWKFPGGCPRGQVARNDSILTKARKYVELCDGPIYPDFNDPPGAMLRGEEALWSSHRYGEGLGHCEYPTFLLDTREPNIHPLHTFSG